MFAHCTESLLPRELKSPYYAEDSVNIGEEGEHTEIGEQVSQTEDQMSSMASRVVERTGRERERLGQASVRKKRRAGMESTCGER
jgi:hypothetical protein